MEAIETQIKTVDATKVIPIPEEMFATLGLHEGSRVAISLSDGRIIVKPVADDLHGALERIRDMVAAAPGPSLETILAELRQEQEERDERLLG